jgi:Leucine rich repeat
LNTLILSKNSISDFSVAEVGSFLHLTKLSIGKNMLKSLPDLSASVNLTELRINNNLLTTIGDSILNNKKLKTLDISNNLLTSWEEIKKLVGLPLLTNLGVKGNNFPAPPESTDDLEVREDKAAETIDDVTERRFRRFILSMFLKTVGAANKSFEQLIVLDMKRVKMKLSPGMSAGGTEESAVGVRTATPTSAISTKGSKKTLKARPAPASEHDEDELTGKKKKMKRTLGHSESATATATTTQKDALKKRKKGTELESEQEPVSAILSHEAEKPKKKKKSSVVDDSFLNSDEGKGTKERKVDKSAHIGSTPSSSSSSTFSTSALGSGVISVIVHKKAVKASSLGNGSRAIGIADSVSTGNALSVGVSAGAGRDYLKGAVSASVSVDDAAVSSVLGGNTSASNLVGIGGSSAW